MQGLTNAEIARCVKRSPSTVRTQVESILFKLGVPNRTAAAMLAKSVSTRIKGAVRLY